MIDFIDRVHIAGQEAHESYPYQVPECRTNQTPPSTCLFAAGDYQLLVLRNLGRGKLGPDSKALLGSVDRRDMKLKQRKDADRGLASNRENTWPL